VFTVLLSEKGKALPSQAASNHIISLFQNKVSTLLISAQIQE
jgi:hypothetical protein